MIPGEAREGEAVYTRCQVSGEKVYRIVRAVINQIIYPGTTNEYYQMTYQNLEGGLHIDRKPALCEREMKLARKALVLEVYAQMDDLRIQLLALGDHTMADSHWKEK